MQTYLFDFDGTLVDSMPAYSKTMLDLLAEYHVPHSEDIIKIITPLGYTLTARYFKQTLGFPLEEAEILSHISTRLGDAYRHTIPAKKNVPEVLIKLRERGAKLNVLTASPHEMLDPCLDRLGLMPLFDNVWSCEEFGMGKSDPEIYRVAAARLGVQASELIFLDDNLNADKTAKAAGLTVFGVFDPSSAEYEQEMRAVCDRYIKDFCELL